MVGVAWGACGLREEELVGGERTQEWGGSDAWRTFQRKWCDWYLQKPIAQALQIKKENNGSTFVNSSGQSLFS